MKGSGLQIGVEVEVGKGKGEGGGKGGVHVGGGVDIGQVGGEGVITLITLVGWWV